MAIESMNAAAVATSVQQTNTQQTQTQHVERAEPVQQPNRAQEQIQETEQVSSEQLEAAIERLNDLMKDGQRSLAFSVDKELDEVVVKVMDTDTEEVIRQIPNEESLRFAKNLEGVLGVIFNDKA